MYRACSRSMHMLRALALAATLGVGVLAPFARAADAPAADAPGASVLIIHSNQRPTPAAVVIEDTVRKSLPGLLGRPADIYSEYLEDEWIAAPAYGDAQAEFLKAKYGERNVGVIITAAPAALDFVLRRRSAVFPGVPIVPIALPLDSPVRRGLPAEVVGKPIDLDPTRTFDLMRRLHPDVSIWTIVLGGSDRDKAWERRVRAAMKDVDGITPVYMTGVPTPELLTRLHGLDKRTIVFTPGYFSDGTGEIVTPRRSVERIAEASAVPVYGTLDTFLGTGIVGGYMTPYEEQAKEAARIAARLLRGDPPASIDTSPVARVPMFDARALKRFNIEDTSLPVDAVVFNREKSVWRHYQFEIAIGITILLLQLLLIVSLLVQRGRRRAAEHASSALAGRLLTAHEDERRRLARDLHDDVTQRLARLAIDAARIERGATESQAKAAARGVRDDLVRLSEDVHALSYRLHPSLLDDLGLAEGLKAECGRLSQQQAMAVNVEVGEVPGKLPREPSLCLFRIAQEALRNVARHAQAKAVTVSLVPEGRGLRLTVRDDGRGFDADSDEQSPSLGRVSMRERVRQLGGKLRIDSAPGRGTTVTAWVPLEATP